MIPVSIASLSYSNVGFVVLLRGQHDRRILPVFIGPAEAQAIELVREKIQVPRPMTHDLFKNVLDCLESRLKRVEICDLVDNTFYAKLILEHAAGETRVDSRPSDAIALALRFAAPILVDEKVMDQAGVVVPEDAAPRSSEVSEEGHGDPAKARITVQSLQEELQKAIGDERYEDAARLRDEIKRLQSPHATN